MKIRQFGLILIMAFIFIACDITEDLLEDEGSENESGLYTSQEEQLADNQDEIEPEQEFTSAPDSFPSGQTDIPLPHEGYLYHGAFPGGITDWGEEDDMTPDDLHSYEQLAGKTIAWLYFSHNWFVDREFPYEMASWIRDDGSIPFIRLMLRSDAEQNHSESLFSLDNILRGDFDDDIHAWAIAARDFGSPLLVEFGTEANGEWFSWNGIWNGAGETDDYGDPDIPDGPEKFQNTYRHIIQITRDEEVENITWVFHIDADDVPEEDWNRFENYYPGNEWIDWLGISVYGPSDPMDDDCTTFRESMDATIPRLGALSADKPIVVLEFAAAANNPYCDQLDWTRGALTDLISLRWPRVIGFSWWNENWQNDEDPNHDTVLRIEDSPGLADVFQELVGDQETVLGTIEIEE